MSIDDDDDVGVIGLEHPAIDVLSALVNMMDEKGQDTIEVNFIENKFGEHITLELYKKPRELDTLDIQL